MDRMDALATVTISGRPVVLRRATAEDLPGIVALLVEDPVGGARESAEDIAAYRRAFQAIDADQAHLLVVADDGNGVVGTMQLSVLPALPHRGALRAQLEGVHVRPDRRGNGLGAAMITWAVEGARRRGCALVQLTSDKRRAAAHRFYARLGFAASHVGFKLKL
jgi:GNAT superfamily N-acetyltransferase